jgi:hypothetical protein
VGSGGLLKGGFLIVRGDFDKIVDVVGEIMLFNRSNGKSRITIERLRK